MPVGSPIITEPDVLVAMNLPSLQKFVDSVVPGGKILVDSTLIDAKVERTDVEVFYIPATQMAKDAGYATLANMILMGKVMKESDAVDYAGNKETLETFIPAKKANLIDVNCQALQAGYDF
jgi:2-oxoglutarate ferredoxin oxidoreductase subunit gamma